MTSKKITSKSISYELYRNKLWETEHKILEHHHPNIKSKMRCFSVCYKIPITTYTLENLVINGINVYDFLNNPKRTAQIGGGGRFEIKRQFYDGKIVSCSLLLKDVCYYSTKKPVIKCILGVDE